MTDKELRRLKRSELLELLLMQSRALDEQKQEMADLRDQLNSRKLEQEDVGSIAEASLKLNGVFEAAQAAADQYLANISIMENRCRDMEAETYKKCGDREREAQEHCEKTERRCEEMEKEAKEQCEALLKKAREEADKILEEANQALEEAKKKRDGEPNSGKDGKLKPEPAGEEPKKEEAKPEKKGFLSQKSKRGK